MLAIYWSIIHTYIMTYLYVWFTMAKNLIYHPELVPMPTWRISSIFGCKGWPYFRGVGCRRFHLPIRTAPVLSFSDTPGNLLSFSLLTCEAHLRLLFSRFRWSVEVVTGESSLMTLQWPLQPLITATSPLASLAITTVFPTLHTLSVHFFPINPNDLFFI